MKRTALTRRSPLCSSKPLARSTKVKAINRRRLAKRRALQLGPQAALCRIMPCCSCGAPPPSDPSHLKTRGAGGRDEHCVPQCRRCHDALGSEGAVTFWRRRGLDPAELLEHFRKAAAA